MATTANPAGTERGRPAERRPSQAGPPPGALAGLSLLLLPRGRPRRNSPAEQD